MDWRRDHTGGLVILPKKDTHLNVKKTFPALTRIFFRDIKNFYEGGWYENLQVFSSPRYSFIDRHIFLCL
jgi:hypothetical protein